MTDSTGGVSDSSKPKPSGTQGWWILVVVGLILAAVTARMALFALDALAQGDRRDPLVAGVEAGTVFSLVPGGAIVSSGGGRDKIPALFKPEAVAGARVEQINEEMHGKFLVSHDRVVGVVLNGMARAYPVNILTHHYAINDELGGVPILVTYDPWCDSVAVCERRIDGELLEFAVSSEVYNSNVLLYNRASGAVGESLWSPLKLMALCGPAAQAGLTLTPIHCALMPWAQWLTLHPGTTVISLNTGYGLEYGANPFGPYFATGEPKFPVQPPVADDRLPLMARIVAVWRDGAWSTYVYDTQDYSAAESDVVSWEMDGLRFCRSPLSPAMDPPMLWLTGVDRSEPPVVYSFWFAWHAMHPEEPLPQDAIGPR